MKVDRQKVMDAFAEYTSRYDSTDGKIKLKIDHTYRVAGLCDRIARSLQLPEQDIDLAWLSGMLHDVGRFEQLRQYGTFSDADSIDHAHFAAEILFAQGKLTDYLNLPANIADHITEFADMNRQTSSTNKEETVSIVQDISVLYHAIWNHSAYRVEKSLDIRTQMFCDILRDADKVDILKVNQDVPIEVIYNVTTEELRNAEVTEAVMQEFFKQRAILRSLKRTCVDHIVGHAALVFELVYEESRRIVKEQGYLERLLNFTSDNPKTAEQFAMLRRCMADYRRG